ncbi:MAG: heme ABC transporter permease CcmB [Dehalococcoidia bacterium]|nr:heme ABC transporter permease CcmB [Dehalococcoidia bacterium]
MSDFLLPVLTIAWKDVLLELRTKEVVTSVLMFALLAMVTFSFAFDPSPQVITLVAPGILWVAFTFAGILGFNRAFTLEKENGSLEGLLLCPVSRDVLYFGKLLGIFLFMMVMELMLLPFFAVIYNLPVLDIKLLLLSALATLGFSGVGALFSAIAVNTRSREIMLPVLLLPVASPIVIAAVESTRAVLEGASWGEMGRWLGLVAAFDVIFLIVSSFVFGAVLEE